MVELCAGCAVDACILFALCVRFYCFMVLLATQSHEFELGTHINGINAPPSSLFVWPAPFRSTIASVPDIPPLFIAIGNKSYLLLCL